jgi:hypothetical protein
MEITVVGYCTPLLQTLSDQLALDFESLLLYCRL